MRSGKFYAGLAKLNDNIRQFRFLRFIILPAILLCSLPVFAQQLYQVTNSSGTTTINTFSVTVTSSGSVASGAICLPESGLYKVNTSGSSYTFSFSSPVANVIIPAIFDNNSTNGQLHVDVNGVPYIITPSHLSSIVSSACSNASASLSTGDLVNTGNTTNSAGDVIFITGPVTSVTISSLDANDFLFGMFVQAIGFSAGDSQPLTVCKNSGPVDIASYLQVNTAVSGSTVTWTSLSDPTNGTLSGLPASGPFVGPTLSPDPGITYAPNPGYSGPDVFVIQATDGTATTITTINVTVNNLPDITLGANPSILPGAANADFSYTIGTGSPTLYSITWTGAASGVYTDITNAALTTTPIVVPVSNSAPTNIYPGTLTVSDGTCVSAGYPVSVTVNTPPSFDGSPIYTSTCEGSADSMNMILEVTDADAGQTETWTVTSLPVNGTLAGISGTYSMTSTGGSAPLVPVGLAYIPDPGFSGADFFTVQVNDGLGGTASTTVFVAVNPSPSLNIGPGVAVCAGVTNANITFTGLTNIGPDTLYFFYTGVPQSVQVPVGVNSVAFDVRGAAGGKDNVSMSPNPGLGGRVTGSLTVTPGQQLNVYVGGAGGDGTSGGASGGYNGGGNSFGYSYGSGGGGGGASDIRLDGTALANRVVVAGGGGGNGWDSPGALAGGAGGDVVGGNSADNTGGMHATGGSGSGPGAGATYAGWLPGANGVNNRGGDGSVSGISGGGGGGFFGGGGGIWTGGAGGSSYTDPALVTSHVHTQGYNNGNGYVVVSYAMPGTWHIDWSGAALTAGFVNTTDVVSASPVSVAVPAGAPAAVYTGTLTLNNTFCTSPGYTITVTVNPLPSVAHIADTAICDSGFTPDITFPASYTWTNNRPGFGVPGLPPTSSGHIASFMVVNNTPTPDTATIIVTPVSAITGCTGTPDTFKITANPIPKLNSTLTPHSICDSALFTYVPTSATGTTSFTWSRDAISGIYNAANIGTFNPLENLIDTANSPLPVVYTYTLSANGCANVQHVTVIVDPLPLLTSTDTFAKCDNLLFSYTPTSNVGGAAFAWTRAVVAGISNPAGSGMGDPAEILSNTTNLPLVVTYQYSLSANTCANPNPHAVTVTVNPLPLLTSPLALAPICDSFNVVYAPSSNVGVTTFAWSRSLITGIANPAAGNPGSINEQLYNTTPYKIAVPYTYTLSAYGCTNQAVVVDTVKPTPKLNSTLTPPSICDSSLFSYSPSSLTPGTTFNWVRDSIVGINDPSTASVNSVNEILVNTTTSSIPVIYLYNLQADGCVDSERVVVIVKSKPTLSSSLTPAGVCDSALFNYNPSSAYPDSSFSWYRPYVMGISDPAATGLGNPNESLVNTTYINVDVTYQFTIVSGTCVGTQDVTVQVHPDPKLATNHADTVCSGAPFSYVPFTYTPATSFTWSRPGVTGIAQPFSSGSGDIADVLTDTLGSPVNAYYYYVLTANGCADTEVVRVSVNASPVIPLITTKSPSNVCQNTAFQNFGAAYAPPAGVTYTWSADNATVWATGNNRQYCLVTFGAAGKAVVTLNVNNETTGCLSSNTDTVNVSASSADAPSVIYFDGQFICRQTSEDSYQWGFDDAHTLDSTIIPGETNQNYANTSPDMINKLYWVITTHDGCMQKSYYNVPTGIANVNSGEETSVRIYPNPASQLINVDINTIAGGKIEVRVVNMLGQSLSAVSTEEHKVSINVNDLASGCYLIDCYRDGVKIATARFIKN